MSDTKSGMGFLSWLLILFIGLKLCGVINWSWLWVLSPIWMPLAALFPLLVLVFWLKRREGGK